MTRTLRTRFLRLITLLIFAAGCDPQPAVKIATDVGFEAETATRIISLAPSVTETLFALGVGSRVVGVTRFCDFPDQVKAVRKVGGLTDVDVEIVLSLKPDLVVGVNSKSAQSLEKTLRLAGVATLFLPVETFADVQAAMRTLGERVGAVDKAEELAKAISSQHVTPSAQPPSVLVLFGREPWIAAGPKTFADEMIRRAGGVNALAHLDNPYPTLDVERLGALSADVVIDTSWGTADAPVPLAKPISVTRLDPALIRPGPRLVQAMSIFRDAVAAAEMR